MIKRERVARLPRIVLLVCALSIACGVAVPSAEPEPSPVPPSGIVKMIDAAVPARLRVELVLTGPTADDPFRGPNGVTVGPDGTVYIADTGAKRIVRFDSSGRALGVFGLGDPAAGGLDAPVDLVVTASGRVVVLDRGTGDLVTFESNGRYVGRFTGPGFYNPFGLAAAGDSLVVADTGTGRVMRFSPDGAIDREIATRDQQLGQTKDPSGAVVESDGTIVVADGARGTALRYRADGVFVDEGDIGISGLARIIRLGDGSFLASDPLRSRLVRWRLPATFLARYATEEGAEELVHPTGLAADGSGAIYVVDTQMNRVLRLSAP